MARGVGEGADDGVGAQRLAHGADLAGAVGQVHAVEAEAGDEAEMVGDHQRHVARVADGAERVGGAGDLVLGAGGEREPDAGDSGRVEQRGEAVGQAGIEGGRGDQVEPRPRRRRASP